MAAGPSEIAELCLVGGAEPLFFVDDHESEVGVFDLLGGDGAGADDDGDGAIG